MDMTPELKIAIKITKHLNQMLTKEFKDSSSRSIRFKKHKEIVTPADLKANKYITKTLLKKFPTYDILSEEAKEIDNADTKRWFIDPLDGTTNFAYGFPEFATCIALENKGEILSGVVGIPKMNEVYYAEKGQGAWVDKKKISVSEVDSIDDAMNLICRGHSPSGKKRFRKLLPNLGVDQGRFRMFSSAGIDLTSIASGKAEICIMCNIHPWDVLAGVILIREAGGKVTSFSGKDWKLGDDTMVATNGTLHKEALKLTEGIV